MLVPDNDANWFRGYVDTMQLPGAAMVCACAAAEVA